MDNDIKKTANWDPGTLDKTRKNIGSIDASEAANMAKKLGGEVLYERSTANGTPSGGRAPTKPSAPRQSSSSRPKSSASSTLTTPKRYIREDLPVIPKKVSSLIDKIMMSPEYKLKLNLGIFNFLRTLQKNGSEKVNPELYDYTIKQQIEHIETFITVIKTLIQIAPATYKSKIASGTEPKFKFLRMVAGWSLGPIKAEFANLDNAPQPLIVADFIPLMKAFYRPLITVYYFGDNKIPKLIKEIYTDESAYPDSPQEKLSGYAKQAITEWLYITNEIIKKYYPFLLRMCSDTFESYPTFFTVKVADILKFVGLHKFDLLLPEKPKEPPKEQKKNTTPPPQKGVKDSTVITGLKILDQLFPDAGFSHLEDHPDMYPYFQPIFNFDDGFNLLSPNNPLQMIVVLQRILEDCFQGCRNIRFAEPEQQKQGADSISNILDEWSAYREDSFVRLYCDPLVDFVNTLYSQPDFDQSHIGKKTLSSLLWQITYHFMPNFKFDQLLLEHPSDESKYRPMFHRTDFARKFFTLVVNECDKNAKTKGACKLVENPWEHYKFDIGNEVSKRLDVILGAQNKTASTNANNANLIKYTLCIVAVLDWWINNPDSPAYTTNPMDIYRISPEDGKPVFSVDTRKDQNKLFVDAIKASYQHKAQ